MFRLFFIGILGALVILGLGFAYQSYLVSNVVPTGPTLAADEGYCCMATGTCLIKQKTDCASFFVQDEKSCEARCTSAR